MRTLVTTIILALVCLSAPAFALPTDGALVRIDSPPPGAAASLLEEGVEVVRDAGWYLVAVASPGDIAVLERLGWPYEVLDESVAGKVYYTITRPLESPAPFPSEIRLLYSTPLSAVVEGDDLKAGGEIQGKRGVAEGSGLKAATVRIRDRRKAVEVRAGGADVVEDEMAAVRRRARGK